MGPGRNNCAEYYQISHFGQYPGEAGETVRWMGTNYQGWKFQITAVLTANETYDVVDGSRTMPADRLGPNERSNNMPNIAWPHGSRVPGARLRRVVKGDAASNHAPR